jgi:putative PEP-CTERM system histidine kinase
MELLLIQIVTLFLYTGILVYSIFRKRWLDLTFIIALILTILWLAQSVYNNYFSDRYYVNYFGTTLSLYGWMLFLQFTYLKIPNTRAMRLVPAYGINLILVSIFLLQFYINGISHPQLLNVESLYFACLVISIASLFFIENIVRCLKMDYRYTLKHLLFALSAMAIVNMFHFYHLLIYHEANSFLQYLSLVMYLVIPAFIFISLLRIPKIDINVFEPNETGQAQYFLILAGSGLVVAGVMQMFDLYFSQVRSDFYQALFTVLLFSAIGILILSHLFRSELGLYLRTYFYGDSNDYKREWEKVGRITREESGIYERVARYFQQLLAADESALYARRSNNEFQCLSSTQPVFPSRLSNKKEFWDLCRKMAESVYLYEDASETYRQQLFVLLHVEQDVIGLCWLKSQTAPLNIDSASLRLCETVSNEFAIRLREIEHKSELRRQEKLSGFNRIVSFLAHDLKNIMAQQKLALENFSQYREDPEFLDDFQETILNSTNRLEKLVSQFRYKSLNSGSEAVRLSALDLELTNKIRQYHGQIDYQFKNLREVDISVDADIRLVIENLLKNALEASPGKTPVSLKITLDQDLQILVSDQGLGMSQEFIDQELFEPFISESTEQGLGIGMYHVKTIVERLKGSIKVKSEVEQGTTFTIKIPV